MSSQKPMSYRARRNLRASKLGVLASDNSKFGGDAWPSQLLEPSANPPEAPDSFFSPYSEYSSETPNSPKPGDEDTIPNKDSASSTVNPTASEHLRLSQPSYKPLPIGKTSRSKVRKSKVAEAESIGTANISELAGRPPTALDLDGNVSRYAESTSGNQTSSQGDSPITGPSSFEEPQHLLKTVASSTCWYSPERREYISKHPVDDFSVPTPPALPEPVKPRLPSATAEPFKEPPIVAQTSTKSDTLSPFRAHARASSNPPAVDSQQSPAYQPNVIESVCELDSGIKAGERGYYFGFDNLPCTNGLADNHVVLAGFEGGVDVFSTSQRGPGPRIATVRGLRGGVVHAKILPWVVDELQDIYIALVIHGPVLPTSSGSAESPKQHPKSSTSSSDDVPTTVTAKSIQFYQTSVEVYSLTTGHRVDVLLEAAKISVMPMIKVPAPSGTFRILADMGAVVVTSGKTGECWLFRHYPAAEGANKFFHVAKLWTCLQQHPKVDATMQPPPSPTVAPQSTARPSPHMPIVSMSGRYVAYCPATPSSQLALKAAVSVPTSRRAPGTGLMSPPPLPVVGAELDVPEVPGVMNKLLRETTQEVIVQAKWVGQQGKRWWNDYWNKGQQPTARPALSPPKMEWPAADTLQFPPTHGLPSPAPPTSSDPAIVSVIDTMDLGSSAVTVQSVVCFSLQNSGCSFLSLSPDGLALFTASTKGDVQTVWDLRQIVYAKSSVLQVKQREPVRGPRVRQIAQFSRLTVARITSVDWTRPLGKRLAVVTDRGTVHMHDMPSRAYSWPPARRRFDAAEASKTKTASEQPTSNVAAATTAAVSIASTALTTATSLARMRRQRRLSLQTGGTHAVPTIADHATHGGRLLAAGVSSGLSKTGNAINQLRQAAENRASLPLSTSAVPDASSAAWLVGRKMPVLAGLGEGVIRIFPRKSRKSQVPPSTSSPWTSIRNVSGGSNKGSPRDFSVPLLPGDLLAPMVKQWIEVDKHNGGDANTESCSTLGPENSRQSAGRQQLLSCLKAAVAAQQQLWIYYSELESSSAHQPFHTDSRVAVYLVENHPTRSCHTNSSQPSNATCRSDSSKHTTASSNAARTKASCWIYGRPVAMTKISVGTRDSEMVFNIDDEYLDNYLLTTEPADRSGSGHSGGGNDVGDDDDGLLFDNNCVMLDFANQHR